VLSGKSDADLCKRRALRARRDATRSTDAIKVTRRHAKTDRARTLDFYYII
jgi:hypothetical protein